MYLYNILSGDEIEYVVDSWSNRTCALPRTPLTQTSMRKHVLMVIKYSKYDS